MIRYDKFTKQFRSVTAVHELTLDLIPGETLALIGPNGSGKTTTLKAALGLVIPTSGTVEVLGVPVRPGNSGTREQIGYLPQRLSFPSGCTATEVMRLFAALRGLSRDVIANLLERVDLLAHSNRTVDGFSGGMRQRLGIAIALLGDPAILILDEPTAALDPTGSLMMRDIIRGIAAEGRTVVLSSHDLAEVQALASRVAVFGGGRLSALGTIHDLAIEHAAVSLEAIYKAVTADLRAAWCQRTECCSHS